MTLFEAMPKNISNTLFLLAIAGLLGGFLLQLAGHWYLKWTWRPVPRVPKSEPTIEPDRPESDSPYSPPITTTAAEEGDIFSPPPKIYAASAFRASSASIFFAGVYFGLIGQGIHYLRRSNLWNPSLTLQIIGGMTIVAIAFLTIAGIVKLLSRLPKYSSAMIVTLLWLPLLAAAIFAARAITLAIGGESLI